MTERPSFATALSVVLSVGVLAYVALQLDWTKTADIFAKIHWGWLALGLVVFFINYALRTFRFRLLVYSQRLPFARLMGVMNVYGMFNYLMPAKSGELSYLFLVKRYLHIALSESAATLVTARFFDFATLALFLPAVIIVFWQMLPSWLIYASVVFCAAVYGAGVVLLILLRGGGGAAHPGEDSAAGSGIARLWRETMAGLRLIYRRGQYAGIWALTILIWLCVYLNFYCIVRSLGFDVGLLEMVVVSIILVPMTLLPVQGVANLGTHEAAWVAAFAMFGYTIDTSLTVAVGTHVILLSFVLILGAAGLMLLRGGSQRSRAFAVMRNLDG